MLLVFNNQPLRNEEQFKGRWSNVEAAIFSISNSLIVKTLIPHRHHTCIVKHKCLYKCKLKMTTIVSKL